MSPFALRLAFLAAVLPACSGDDDDDDDPCGDVIYAGASTDEAWRTMVDGYDSSEIGDPSAPDVTSPTEDQIYEADAAAPEIEWTSAIARGVKVRRVLRESAPGFWDRLGDLVEGTAWAHLPPITGDVYYLQITIPGRECPIRAVTTDESWQVDEASWTTLQQSAGETLSLDIESAYLTENRITEGPYRPAAPRTFRIAAP